MASRDLDRALPYTQAVVTPGAAGRLQRCCRVFRTIFCGEWLWEQLCADALAEGDLRGKSACQTWRALYASWAEGGWFRAYATMARRLLEQGAPSMSLRFQGDRVPLHWHDADCLQVRDLRATDFGVTGRAGFSDDSELPAWNYIDSFVEGASVIVSFGGEEAKHCTVLEVDCSKERAYNFFLDWVTHPGVRRAGLYLSHTIWEDDDNVTGRLQMLDVVVTVPTPRFLEAVLGPERMRQQAAELLGIGGLRGRPSDGLTLYAELRQQAPRGGEQQVFQSEEAQPVVARIQAAVPPPLWRDLKRDFFFRQIYKQAVRQTVWDAKPVPSLDFAFDFEEVRECSLDRFLLSFWCLDSAGQSAFAAHFVPFSTNPIVEGGRKAKCVVHAPAVVRPDTRWQFFLAKLTARSGPHLLPVPGGASPGVHQLHLIMPSFGLPESFDLSECLRAALADHLQRKGHGDGAESDSESDREEERSWWVDRAYMEQEELAFRLQRARLFEPAEGPLEPSPDGSPWRGLAPLRRCRTCRCILTMSLDRERCNRCDW